MTAIEPAEVFALADAPPVARPALDFIGGVLVGAGASAIANLVTQAYSRRRRVAWIATAALIAGGAVFVFSARRAA